MLDKALGEIYGRCRENFFRSVFFRIRERVGRLTAVEVFSLEVIRILGRPTISEFARFIGVSQSGATYKIDSLERKGYVRRELSDQDKRESYLVLTEKYEAYGSIGSDYVSRVAERIREAFAPDQVKKLEELLGGVCREMTAESANRPK